MLRLIIVATFVILFLICSIPLFFIEWLIGKWKPDVKSRSSLAIVNWAFRVVAFLSGTKVITVGEENVPKDKAVLYVGNHRSFYDLSQSAASYRLCGKKGNAQGSPAFCLDEIPALLIP